ncbi:uncharacterized protein ACLA_016870 [Aspergillus clavatus NRRL 1]|uniref:Uncharacterized protein n=1 Tax=Aspergillus clavatus (strain ATCC 1007 / CBS 513.65 / DSM 816 / NCTC 3887 / NRRL 1 / QM 1276 / 107) TaxID=344612 RepID=A1CBX3_ASPCL|nr:uncharacterized protein ACLA_016870 [Aspergillus clavatus NRRL 1]EAW13241.1 conserved hypothetical protein [Aspergillus clavatus NRRL 1]
MDFLASQSSSEFSSVESESEDPLAQLAKEVTQQPFTNNKHFHKSLECHQRALQQDQTRDQYLVFTSVPPKQLSKLSSEWSRTSKSSRFFTNAETRILIVKFMPGPAHELAIRRFDLLISLELRAMNVDNDMSSLGSTTVTVGNWTKEADCCWAPASPNVRLSFVVEVGLSESARKLALDARGWLETYSSPVKLVVTISINRDTPEIILHRWELAPPQGYRVITRSGSIPARRTAFLKLSRTNNTTSVTGESDRNGTTTTTTQLDLPFDKIVGRPPHQPLERDLMITEHELRRFAEDIWIHQSFL